MKNLNLLRNLSVIHLIAAIQKMYNLNLCEKIVPNHHRINYKNIKEKIVFRLKLSPLLILLRNYLRFIHLLDVFLFKCTLLV